MSPAGAGIFSPGDILVSDDEYHAVFRLDPGTGSKTTVSEGHPLRYAAGIALEFGGILVLDSEARVVDDDQRSVYTGAVIRVDPGTGEQTIVTTFGAHSWPVGIARWTNGDILVSDASESGQKGAVIRVDPETGAQTTVSRFASGRLGGIALDTDGHILVCGRDVFGSGAVIRVDPGTGAQTIVSSGGLVDEPTRAISVEADGDILVAEGVEGHGQLIRVDPTTGAQTIASSYGALVRPTGIAVVPPALSPSFIASLIKRVRGPLEHVTPPGILWSLLAKLEGAERDLAKKEPAQAGEKLAAFIHQVAELSGKELAKADAGALIDHAEAVRAAVGGMPVPPVAAPPTIASLIRDVGALELTPPDIAKSLLAKLEGAERDLAKTEPAQAGEKLAAFIHQVAELSGKELAKADADALIDHAEALRAAGGGTS